MTNKTTKCYKYIMLIQAKSQGFYFFYFL